MRKTIFDVIDNIDSDNLIQFTYNRIYKLFFSDKINYRGYIVTLCELAEKYCFREWEYSQLCEDISEFIDLCNLPIDDDEITIEDFLINVEFIANMINLLVENISGTGDLPKEIKSIRKNMKFILDKYNYRFYEVEKNRIIIVPKSEIIENIAIHNEDIAPSIFEYQSTSIKGNLSRKRELLLAIARKFEGIEMNLKNNGCKSLADDVRCLLNNLHIRHNNKEGKEAKDFVKNCSEIELEAWYDKTYDLLLLAIMTENCLPYKKDIKDLCKLL